MQWDRVINRRGDAFGGEVPHDRVPARAENRVLVKHVRAPWGFGRQRDRKFREPLRVPPGDPAPCRVPGVDPRQLGAQNRRLELVEAAVVAELGVVIALAAAVVPQAADALGDRVGIGRDQAAVARAAEILARVEAEAAGQADAAGHGAWRARAEGLRAILDHDQPAPRCDLHDRVHLRRAPEEVHRDDRARRRGERRLDGLGSDVEARAIDIDEHRARAGVHDALDRRDEGERRRHDLVAWPDAGPAQAKQECVGARADADRVAHAEVFRRLALERGDVRAHHVLARVQHRAHGRLDFLPERRVLDLQVDQRDHERRVPISRAAAPAPTRPAISIAVSSARLPSSPVTGGG